MIPVVNRSEARLKAAVIDRLYAGAHVDDDAVLISEMTVANWARRADVVLANGKLWGFEIKSEVDSLGRLQGQVDAFRGYFEKLVIVIAARFEARVLAMVPDSVGVWVEGTDGVLKERVRPKHLPLEPPASISLMTATELRRLLTANGLRCAKDAPRSALEAAALNLTAPDLAVAARNAIKSRHRDRHLTFAQYRCEHGTLGAMWQLRRGGTRRSVVEAEYTCHACPVAEVPIPTDHPLLVNAPAGPILKRRLS